jgi:hypothetical protein
VRFAAAFDDPAACPVLGAKSIETMWAPPERISRKGYTPGDAYYACGWSVRDFGDGRRNTWHNGSLPGTYTVLARWRTGVSCAVLFNRRCSDSGKIDPLLSRAIRSITVWPDHDLFGRFFPAHED